MDPFERVKRAVRDAMAHSGGRTGAQAPELSAEAAFERGDFAEAETLLAGTVEQTRARPLDRKRYAKSLLLLSSAQAKLEKYAEAKTNAALARPLLEECKLPAEQAECLNVLGSIAVVEDDVTKAVDLFQEAVESAERVRPQNPLTTSNLLRRWSEALRKSRDFERAKSAASRALNLVQERYGKDDVNTGECLLELGQCEREGGDPAGAILTLRRALDIFQLDRGRDTDHEIRTLQALADACQAAGDPEQAVGYYERALQQRERQLGGKAEDIASLLTNLGGLLSLLGRHGPAIELLQQAVVRLEGSRDERLGSALDLLGNTYFQFGRFEDAVTCVRSARNIWESVPTGHEEALQANQSLLEDIAGYLPYQRRIALGLPAATPEAESAEAGKHRKAPAPWDTPEKVEKHASADHRAIQQPRDPVSARPPLREPSRALGQDSPTLQPGTTEALNGYAGADPRGLSYLTPIPPGMACAPPPGFVPATEYGPVAWPVPGAEPLVPVSYAYPGSQGVVAGRPRLPGMTVSVVRPDGTVVESGGPQGGPVHLQIVLGEGGLPAMVRTVGPDGPAEQRPSPGLNGWDELGFEFLPGVADKAA
jgi:tetratricopeptide (TPR) repeat protein